MRKLLTALLLSTALAFAGCGGSDDTLVNNDPTVVDPGVPDPPTLAKLTVLTSSPQIPSDGALPVTITAQVQDDANNFVPDVTVQFSADSGGLSISQPVTDTTGRAIAELQTAGDPTNRTINVTATATDAFGNVLTDMVSVQVIGTELILTGASSLASGDTATYTVVLTDANDDGIAGEVVEVTSSAGNGISATTLMTDTEGQAQFVLSANVGGTDNLTVSALGLSTSTAISVSDDTFTFFSPAANTEIDLGADQTVRMRWEQAGAPVVGQTINFSITRGTITPSSAATDGSGEIAVVVNANNAGASTITASAVNGPSTQLSVEFVADTPAFIDVQADPFNVAPNEQATITAIVRDIDNNLVKNETVVFVLDDITGGQLSVGSAVTDSQGRAQTFYTASSTTSANEGVSVTAVVEDDPTVSDSISFTVARRELFLSFGTGNTINEPNEAQYEKVFVVQVTDADGNSVEGVEVQMSVLSVKYLTGYWQANEDANSWFAIQRTSCDDEDVNRNGILDPGEDFNGNGHLEAGNIALVTPTTAVTDNTGSVLISILYPQEYGNWLQVKLEGKTDVQGTEFTESSSFILPIAASDANTLDITPPAPIVPADPANNLPSVTDPFATTLVSPFGYNQDDFTASAGCDFATPPLPLNP